MARKICAVLFYVLAGAALLVGIVSLIGMLIEKVASYYCWAQGVSMALLAAAVVLAACKRPREATILAVLAAAAGYIMGLHMVSAGLSVAAFFKHHASILLPVPFAAALWVFWHKAWLLKEAEEERIARENGVYKDLLKSRK